MNTSALTGTGTVTLIGRNRGLKINGTFNAVGGPYNVVIQTLNGSSVNGLLGAGTDTTANGNYSVTSAGSIAFGGRTINAGTGTISLASTTGYTVSANSALQAGSINIDSQNIVTTGGVLSFNSTTPLSLGNVISGTGGVGVAGGTLTLTGANTYSGTTAIDGGTLTAQGGSAIGDLSTVNFANVAGAALNLAASETIGGIAGGGAAGGTVSCGANTLTLNGTLATSFAGIISGSGPILKTGSGAQTLTGMNTFTGPVTVSAGTLAVSGTGSLGDVPISVASGANFNALPGSGTINLGTNNNGVLGASLVLANGARFSMDDAAVGTANLKQNPAFGGVGLTMDTATLTFNAGISGTDLLAVNGNASVTGPISINIIPVGYTLTAGTYNLIKAASGLSGNYTFAATGTSTNSVVLGVSVYALTLNSTPTAVTLTIGAATPYTAGFSWTGQTNGTGANDTSWNTTGSTNWAQNGAVASFANGAITFVQDINPITGTNATVTALVTQAAGVSPSALTFNNSTVNYTVSNVTGSSIGITGSGQVSKFGTGTVTLTGGQHLHGRHDRQRRNF